MEEIKKYILENPSVGRLRIAQLFNITESEARRIKADTMAVSKYFEEPQDDEFPATKNELNTFLKEHGLTISSIKELLSSKSFSPRNIGDKNINEFSIGIIGDTHLCDKACAMEELFDYYDKCRIAGVKHILHAGDLTAGISVYKGQEFDLSSHGFAEQLKYVVDNYPKVEGITTHVISGNHDLSFKQKSGINFVEEVALRRKDIMWVGDYDATVNVNGVSIGLHHGAGGSAAYSISYKLQKYIEKIGAGQKPQIYVLGHYHSAMTMFYRNIHAMLPGCWQKPNDFSVRLGLPNSICGYISHIKTINDEHNSISSISNELISYYD